VSPSDQGLSGTPHLCCQAPPTFSSGSPDDVVVLKKEATQGSGDCDDVHLITSSDYFIGATYSRKMRLTTIDDDRTTQTSPERSNLALGQLRAPSEKGAEASHATIAESKVNELAEGWYTICYATAESGANEAEDFVKLSKSIEILPKSAVGPSISIPRTVLLGNNINVQWAAQSGYQNKPSEAYSWIGLYRAGECPNGQGEFQNQCYLAWKAVDDGTDGEGSVSFTQADYKGIAGEYEVRYFDGTSRDNHGVICRGMPGVPRETYINCVLESSATSSSIVVYAGIENMDTGSLPGLEIVFNGELARYAGNGGGLPGHNNVQH